MCISACKTAMLAFLIDRATISALKRLKLGEMKRRFNLFKVVLNSRI